MIRELVSRGGTIRFTLNFTQFFSARAERPTIVSPICYLPAIELTRVLKKCAGSAR